MEYPSRKLVIRGDDLLGIPFFPASNFGCCLQTLMSRRTDGVISIFPSVFMSIDFKLDKRDGTAPRQTRPPVVQAPDPCGKPVSSSQWNSRLGARPWQPVESRAAGCFVAALFSCKREFQYLPVRKYFHGNELDIYLDDATSNDI